MRLYGIGFLAVLCLAVSSSFAGEEAPEPSGDLSSALSEFLAQDRLTGDWGGLRSEIEDFGVEINGEYEVDFTRLARGGVNPHDWATRSWLNLNVGLDLEKLVGLPGGRVYAAYWQMNGEYGSTDVGAFQEIVVIESPERQEFAELYYEQTFLEEFRVKVGKMDATYDFAYVDHGDDFMNLGIVFPPNLIGIPVYADPACGVAAFYEPETGPQFSLGAFDGSASEGVKTGIRGAGTLFGPPSAWYCIAEAGYVGDCAEMPFRIAAGGWLHTGNFEKFSGGTMDGTTGAYGILDLRLWAPEGAEAEASGEAAETAAEEAAAEEEEDTRGLYLILRVTSANEKISPIERHYVAALSWWGPLPGRESDTLNMAWEYGDLSDDQDTGFTHQSEQVVELSYKLQLTPFLALTPSIQVIVDPGGVADDALVFGLRVLVVF